MEENIIVIDDDAIALVILQKMIAVINPSLTVLTFEKGKEAIQYLHKKKYKSPPYILADFHLKDIVGWELLEEIETIPEFDSKVFLISSSVSTDLPFRSQRYKSVAGFLEKPITFDMLRSINELIHQK